MSLREIIIILVVRDRLQILLLILRKLGELINFYSPLVFQ